MGNRCVIRFHECLSELKHSCHTNVKCVSESIDENQNSHPPTIYSSASHVLSNKLTQSAVEDWFLYNWTSKNIPKTIISILQLDIQKSCDCIISVLSQKFHYIFPQYPNFIETLLSITKWLQCVYIQITAAATSTQTTTFQENNKSDKIVLTIILILDFSFPMDSIYISSIINLRSSILCFFSSLESLPLDSESILQKHTIQISKLLKQHQPQNLDKKSDENSNRKLQNNEFKRKLSESDSNCSLDTSTTEPTTPTPTPSPIVPMENNEENIFWNSTPTSMMQSTICTIKPKNYSNLNFNLKIDTKMTPIVLLSENNAPTPILTPIDSLSFKKDLTLSSKEEEEEEEEDENKHIMKAISPITTPVRISSEENVDRNQKVNERSEDLDFEWIEHYSHSPL